ncbi:MAG TPA: GGDEF domain-containing protein [Thermoguttaceae bacterium]
MASKSAASVKILISADKAENVWLWTEALRSISDSVWLDASLIPNDQQPDVIITDRDSAFEGPSGVIRVGNDNPADVNLPADTSPRELQLACRLMGEIVHLRRSQHMIAQQQHRLYAEAFTDPLTNLPNRRAWDETLPKRLAAITDSLCLCLAVFDLDYFKKINDDFGHTVGDEVLKSVAEAISASLRQGDFVARIGGDEFGLLLWLPEAGIAPTVVERIRSALPDFLAKNIGQRVTASAGLTVFTGESSVTNPNVLFERADQSLRCAKQQGRDRTVI